MGILQFSSLELGPRGFEERQFLKRCAQVPYENEPSTAIPVMVRVPGQRLLHRPDLQVGQIHHQNDQAKCTQLPT